MRPKPQLVEIPAGNIVTLWQLPLRTGIVEIEFEGRTLGVFLLDLKDRGELVKQTSK